jgi:hypothetical protein
MPSRLAELEKPILAVSVIALSVNVLGRRSQQKPVWVNKASRVVNLVVIGKAVNKGHRGKMPLVVKKFTN